MRAAIAVTAIIAVGLLGCSRPRPDGPPPPPKGPAADVGPHVDSSRVVQAYSLFGSASVKTTAEQCAGRVTLAQGAAIVNDNCFSGDTNIVVCTDTSAPNPVMCAPHRGQLAVAGAGSDTISYARVQ